MMNLKKFRSTINTSLKTWQWWLIGATCFLVFKNMMGWLEGLYQATRFPVPLVEGQTTFNGELVRSYYATLIEHGTMDKYIHVQLIDYIFMLTMFAAIVSLTMAAYRSLPANTWIKEVAWWIAIIAPFAPALDALENAIAFFMLANPQEFPDILAVIHSTFAVGKFALSGFGISWAMIVGVIMLPVCLWHKIVKSMQVKPIN